MLPELPQVRGVYWKWKGCESGGCCESTVIDIGGGGGGGQPLVCVQQLHGTGSFTRGQLACTQATSTALIEMIQQMFGDESGRGAPAQHCSEH